jgi:spore germination cell wall hydrolase CwlJ-like protein
MTGTKAVLARDIYRDLYEEPGPSFGEKVALAGKRLALTLAGGALLLGALDFAGVHSIPGVDSLLQSARMRIAGDTAPPRKVATMSPETVRVIIHKASSKARVQPPSPLDDLMAASRKDALTLAMTSQALIPPALDVAADTSPPKLAAASEPARQPLPARIESQVAALMPAQSAPSPVAPSAAPPIDLPEVAARSQASVPPVAEVQLASLTTSEPMPAPVVATAPVVIPLSEVPLPRMAPPISPADRLNLKGKDYARAERCLTDAIYFEARSEPIRGQMAVAQVVLNRVFSGFYPSDICGVVYQNANRHLACQFTFACDGKPERVTDRRHWAIAKRIARKTLDGQIYVPEVAKSTHYHASYVHPRWVREMRRMVRFGVHSFYRPYAWGNGAKEPIWGKAGTVARVHRTAAR